MDASDVITGQGGCALQSINQKIEKIKGKSQVLPHKAGQQSLKPVLYNREIPSFLSFLIVQKFRISSVVYQEGLALATAARMNGTFFYFFIFILILLLICNIFPRYKIIPTPLFMDYLGSGGDMYDLYI